MFLHMGHSYPIVCSAIQPMFDFVSFRGLILNAWSDVVVVGARHTEAAGTAGRQSGRGADRRVNAAVAEEDTCVGEDAVRWRASDRALGTGDEYGRTVCDGWRAAEASTPSSVTCPALSVPLSRLPFLVDASLPPLLALREVLEASKRLSRCDGR